MIDSKFMPHMLQSGVYDIAVDGEIKTYESKFCYVEDENELELYAGYPAGSIAAKIGFSAMWQKKSDGTWETVYAPAEDAEGSTGET